MRCDETNGEQSAIRRLLDFDEYAQEKQTLESHIGEVNIGTLADNLKDKKKAQKIMNALANCAMPRTN